MVLIFSPITLIESGILLCQNHCHVDRSLAPCSFLRENELAILLDALRARGDEALLQVPGLVIFHTKDLLRKVATYDKLRKIIEEVIKAH